MRAFHSIPPFLPLALLLALACSDGTSPASPSPAVPAALSVVEGDAQQGAAGAELAQPLAVRVVDAASRPVPGAAVRFILSGGGRLSDTAAVADESGVARTRWTLGPSVSAQQGVQAQLPAAPAAAPAWFGALARADAPAVLARVTGEALQGGVGTPLTDSVSVEVRDRHGNPVAGVEVEWEVTAGGGAATPARSVTGATGIARTAWTLGPRADSAQGLQARLAGLDPVAFRADAATRGVTLVLAKRGGDGQSGAAGSLLTDSLGVSLRLPDGRPVAGATVTWAVASGAGSVTPPVSRTDAGGHAAATWRLGTAPGLAQVTATVDGGTLAFTSRVGADAPAAATAVSGGGTGGVGQPLADSLAVRVTDRYGNPAPGVEVAWSAVSGGGSASPARSATDAQGIARAEWRLGAVVDSQAAHATAGGLPPVVFRAAATTRGVPLRLARVAGDGQTGQVGRPLADPLRVRLLTPAGEPVQGASVAWAVTGGGGALGSAAVRTDAQGLASAVWTMGRTAGPAQATASVDEGTLTFGARSRPGAPAAVRADSGGGQRATRGTVLPAPLVAQVVDAYGNGVPDVLVRWAATVGGGQVEADSSRTDAEGRARVRWALGMVPAGNRATAAVDGVPERTFASTATAGPLHLAYETPAVLGLGHHSYVIGVSVRTGTGAPVVGAAVTWTPEWNASVMTPSATRTDWEGITTVRWHSLPFYGPIHGDAAFEQQSLRFTIPRPPPPPRPCYGPWDGYVDIYVVEEGPYYVSDTVRIEVVAFLDWCGEPVDDVVVRVWDDRGVSFEATDSGAFDWPLGPEPHVLTITACTDEGGFCSDLAIDVEARPTAGQAPPPP